MHEDRNILMVMADLAHCYENNSITSSVHTENILRILIFAFTNSEQNTLDAWMLVDHNSTSATFRNSFNFDR